jgi:O-methyltransferase domain/Dimerisation domain
MAGYWVSAAINVAAELNLADLIAAGQQTSAALAQQTHPHPQAMYRLLRTLASVGLFTEVEPGSFELTALGVLLKTDHPMSMRALTRYGCSRMQWQRWGALRRAVETGGSVDREVLGMSGREYRDHHPEEREIFNEAMVSPVLQVGDAVVRAYDFSRFQTLVDVGGGYGALLSAILHRTPQLRAVLFDRPEVIPWARMHLESAGVLDRCQVGGGDFFQRVPPGGDAYLLSRVIHDWNDERATVLLSQCRRAIQPGGTLLLVEEVMLPGDAPCYGKFSDLNMRVGPGG